MGSSRARGVVALLAVLVLVPACGSPAADPPSMRSPGTVGADASRTRAAELQAGVTHLLVERVYATAAARTGEPAAVAALDASAQALADLLGASYQDAREPLLAALRAVDRCAVAGTAAPWEAAQDELAVVLRRVVPRLPAEAVRERLGDDLAAQRAVGDDPYALLRAAAARAPGTAALLSGGIVEDRDLGTAGTRAATLRAQLTGLLTEHVQLAGAVAAAPTDDRAVRALQHGADGLRDLLGTDYPRLAAELGPSWARHVDRVVALARLRTAGQRQAVVAYGEELGALLSRHVGGLPAATTVAEAGPLLTALAAAVEAGASGAPTARAELRRASAAVPVLSALLAAAIAQDRALT